MPPQPDPRDQRREAFIARQIAALRELGFSDAALAREEALLRGGLVGAQVFAALLGGNPP